MSEKTEKPTDKRRRESEKKGKSFKSKDIISTIVMVAGLLYLRYAMVFSEFSSFYQNILQHLNVLDGQYFLAMLGGLFLTTIMPFIAVCFFAGALATLLQTRFVMASQSLKINFGALNPISGFKKIFNVRTIKEVVKSCCYLLVFCVVFYLFCHQQIKLILSGYLMSFEDVVVLWSELTFNAAITFFSFSIIILLSDALVEYFIQFRDMKMEKQEVKREHKENDGDPELKMARKQIHREILSGEEMSAIHHSEVILANPTHIAIGIFFKPDVAILPFVTFRWTNMKARAAIAYAEKIGIPVVRNIKLTRRLYKSYRRHNFILPDDQHLLEVMDILLWLRNVDSCGMGELPSEKEET
ncbi:EscU/YscU/HrcU family type III secretion system export apparatus switch protein [Hafnia paralvei]|uniref:EscU/YscU/HrcU family type III secretion system export apparatus switch protein n=1 Tax=Hafnia paralvei TaxID=546367 RepID=UPI00300D620B